jgi:monofunctional biosynthetic peptidoglycan transglycosylase
MVTGIPSMMRPTSVSSMLPWKMSLDISATVAMVVPSLNELLRITELPTLTGMSKISPSMPVAVMASEDANFLNHHGFDYKAIVNAAERNRKHPEKQKLGASTISQQTAKNIFLWPGRSWTRKGLEAYFTVLIELFWSKERIMEVYLNSIEMGDGIYGVDAVAEANFQTDAKNLSRAQCALIAATLPNPRKFSSKNPSAYMRKRQSKILHEMKFVKPME